MQCGDDVALRSQLVVGLTCLLGGLGDELDAGCLEGLTRCVGNLHATSCALADDQQVWLVIKDGL